jgi:hypothetical protein
MKTVKQLVCLIALFTVLTMPTVAQDPTPTPECQVILRDGVIIYMGNCPQNTQGVIIYMRAQEDSLDLDWTAEAVQLFSQAISTLF